MNLDKMKEEVVSLMEDYFDQLIEERMNVVGQNGNDGLHYVDYGAGPREVEHVVNEKEYWAKLKELPDDE